MRKRSNEPLFWLPFGGGMMADAMLFPALIIITGVLLPFGVISADGFRGLLQNPIIRLILFGVIALTFFHAAHRLRFALVDLGLRALKPAMPFICYGLAALGTIAAALVAFW